MVKVLSFHLFSKQHVTNSELEPVDTCELNDVSFLVATKEGLIQSYSIGEECVLLHQFLSVSQAISKVAYVSLSDCILTMERKHEKSDSMVVRAYFNWRVGISGAVLKQYDDESFEKIDDFGLLHLPEKKEVAIRVFKFPNISNVSALAVCQHTGNIAIASGNSVSIFVKNYEASQTTQPFICLVEIGTLWPSSMLSLCGDCIAYSSPRELQVLRLDVRQIQNKKNNQVYDEGVAPIFGGQGDLIDDTYVVECEYEEKGVIQSNQLYMALGLPSLNIPIKRNVEDSNEFEMIGPFVISDHGVKIWRRSNQYEDDVISLKSPTSSSPTAELEENEENTPNRFYLHKVLLIMHKRFSGPNLIHSIAFHPEFSLPSEIEVPIVEQQELFIPPVEQTNSPLSLSKTKLAGIQFLMSTPNKGYLYDVMNGDKLCEYCFMSESLATAITDSFLYVVTQLGLETWTVRNTLSEKLKSEISVQDSVEFPEPSLFGLQPFISLKSVIATENFLVLLTKHTYNDILQNLPSNMIAKPKRGDSTIALFGSYNPPSGLAGMGSENSTPVKPAPGTSQIKASPMRPLNRRLSTTLTSFVNNEDGKNDSKMSEQVLAGQYLPEDLRGSANWNLYVLAPITVKQLFEDIARMANDKDQIAVKFLILLEGYMLLRAKLASLEANAEMLEKNGGLDFVANLSLTLNIKNMTSLFRFSSSLLADYFVEDHQYHLAAKFFVSSDSKLSEVIKKFEILDQKENDSEADQFDRANALIFYLNEVLFTKEVLEFVDETQELSNDILKNVYHKLAPSEVANLILDSCLNQYDQELAVEILEGLRKQNQGSGGETNSGSTYVRPKEPFALALLYLDMGKLDLAKQMIQEIESECLIQLCTCYYSLLHPIQQDPDSALNNNQNGHDENNEQTEGLPSLGQLVKSCFPSAFLQVILRLRNNKFFPIKTAIQLIRYRDSENKPLNDHMFTLYMESLLEDFESNPIEITDGYFSTLVTELIYIYLQNLKSRLLNKGKVEDGETVTDLSSRKIDFHHFRYQWLDSVEKSKDESSDALIRKIQNLFCSPFPFNPILVLKFLDELCSELPGKSFYGLISFHILIYPLAGRLEDGLRELLNEKPNTHVVVEYAKIFCFNLGDWKLYLDKLLSFPDTLISSSKSPEKEIRQICRDSHLELLDFLTHVIDPNVVLYLLPQDGSLAYFLPIIETALQRFSSRTMKKAMKAEAMNVVKSD